ncbi:tyrosine--tRNA ligase [Candidatus Hydrogenosomobacter endosymbioticus]|uniref:Tyrosine--tRNA ligase n=1 Tax=Candidatus Hydrogenosomobacter endosymbioticus TaxID=2558174 RepID=A0ABN6L249_9PROT|nr:tyrosine--tRNA ligase [Candidatus Hydrogenosomobacter endosymbioticus]
MKTLEDRGFIYQSANSEELDEACVSGSICGYVGFDATAQSLHVGNLMVIMIARWMQKFGHKPVLLMGGGTTKIGDPSGKDKERTMLDESQINNNIDNIKKVFAKMMDFEGECSARIVNNADWLDKLLYIPFLRDIGVHFSVNRMLTFDNVRLRLERQQNLSFIEFNYMLLQSYDFLKLNREYGCVLQFGGADQYGNIVCGIDLVRKVLGKTVYGFTCPLLTTSSGTKMGKSEGRPIWLDSDLLSPYEYWQFWRNVSDADVVRFLKIYTFLPIGEIEELEKMVGSSGINEAKVILADEATAILHGKEVLPSIHENAEFAFKGGAAGAASAGGLPFARTSLEQVESGLLVTDALTSLGFAQSKSAARQYVRDRAVSVNDRVVVSELATVSSADFVKETSSEKLCAKISVGKKKHGLIYLDS